MAHPRVGRSLLWLLLSAALYLGYWWLAKFAVNWLATEQAWQGGGLWLSLLGGAQPDLYDYLSAVVSLMCLPLLLAMADFRQQRWWHTLAMQVPSWSSALLAVFLGAAWALLLMALWQLPSLSVLPLSGQFAGSLLSLLSVVLTNAVFSLLLFGYLFTAWVDNRLPRWGRWLGVLAVMLLGVLFFDLIDDSGNWLANSAFSLMLMASLCGLRLRFRSVWLPMLAQLSFYLLLQSRRWWGV